jgi:hypothetical protein
MSSALRSYAQIPSRAKYFLWGLGDQETDVSVPTTSIFTLPVGAYAELTSMATAAAVNDVANIDPSLPQGLLKDMGRQITIYDPDTKLHRAVYREVQVVDGVASEGVGGSAANGWNSTYFVKVWDAAGAGVNVARTG